MKPADPQAELLTRLSHGGLSPHDVGPGLSLLLAVTIELVFDGSAIVITTAPGQLAPRTFIATRVLR
jgi:hypothetical protein